MKLGVLSLKLIDFCISKNIVICAVGNVFYCVDSVSKFRFYVFECSIAIMLHRGL